MSIASIALRRTPLFFTSSSSASAVPRARLIAAHFSRPAAFSTSTVKMVKDQHKDQSRGEETSGKSEWKQRPPYNVHKKDEDFDVKYEANCHCGKVSYQLSRREPLDSKLCHCTTCQTQHGMFPHTPYPCLHDWLALKAGLISSCSRPIPMGRHLPQRRHQLHQRPPRPRMVRPVQ